MFFNLTLQGIVNMIISLKESRNRRRQAKEKEKEHSLCLDKTIDNDNDNNYEFYNIVVNEFVNNST